MKQAFQIKNETLLSDRVLTKPIDFLFDLTYNPQTQLTTMSIRRKAEAPMVERNDKIQLDVMMAFSNELASVLGIRKTGYWNVADYTSKSVANMDTVNTIYVYCDAIDDRMVGHTLAPLVGVLAVTRNPGAYAYKRYDKIQHHPVLKKNLSNIYFSLRDHQAKRIRFRKREAIVT